MTTLRPGPDPLVSEASLFSYLVTRPTGRAVRMGIEEQVAGCEGEVLTVLDFKDVAVIDYSCADEVVAELAFIAVRRPARLETDPRGPRRRFVLIRGLEAHHQDPIDSALRRRELAVAAELADGQPVLLGAVDESEAHLWRLVCERERIGPEPLDGELGLPEGEARVRLDELYRRRLLLRRAGEYISFRRVLFESAGRRERREPAPDRRGRRDTDTERSSS